MKVLNLRMPPKRNIICKNPDCGITFIGSHKQEYHNTPCRNAHYKVLGVAQYKYRKGRE